MEVDQSWSSASARHAPAYWWHAGSDTRDDDGTVARYSDGVMAPTYEERRARAVSLDHRETDEERERASERGQQRGSCACTRAESEHTGYNATKGATR